MYLIKDKKIRIISFSTFLFIIVLYTVYHKSGTVRP